MRLLACGCAFGLALTLTLTLSMPNEAAPAAAPRKVEPADCSHDFEQVVSQLVAERDRALTAGDAAALFDMTVEGSVVRSQDEDLVASLADSKISELRTRVDSVRLIDCQEDGPLVQLEVHTTQETVTFEGEEPVGELPTRCAVWHLEGRPWKLDALGDC